MSADFGIGKDLSPEEVAQRRCALVSRLSDPERNGEKCPRAANLHVLVRHREHGTQHHLLCCNDHYLAAAIVGELIADHPLGVWCAKPDSSFDLLRNVCVPDDLEPL